MNDKIKNYNEQELNEILNPLDRSKKRFNKILEYVKEHAELEYWEMTNGEQRTIWIKHHLPYHPSPSRNKYYSECYLYKKGETPEDDHAERIKGTKELYNKLADRIFNDN